jgi:phage terminase large subunit-like protein
VISLDPRLTAEDIREAIAIMTEGEARELLYDWDMWARPEQLMPAGDWRVWLIMAGRGFGKTRTGVEAVRKLVNRQPDQRIALVAPTSADCRDVIVEGESGLLNVFPESERPLYEPSKRRITFANGSFATLYSAEEPERLRGPQHNHAYLDEIAVYPEQQLLWDNLMFGLRLGTDPRIIATTTPRPSKFLSSLIASPGTVMSRGSTFENAANLAAPILAEYARIYSGTRIGRQELEGELLEDVEGALWNRTQLDALRVRTAPELTRVVVAIDPAVTSNSDSDDCGITGCGLGVDGQGYLLRDASCHVSPDTWAKRAVDLFDALEADRIIAETNNGGDLVESVIRTIRRNIPFEKVHASRGKVARAEPIAALYEQARIHHVGAFRELEDEQITFVPGALPKSPNRVDALVWGFSYLMLKPQRVGRVLGV